MRIQLLILLPLLISLTYCGGGTSSGTGSGSLSAPTLTSIAVSPTSPSISMGTTQQFTATANYSDGSTKDISSNVTWTSSAANVATISSSGLARSVAVGQTTIAAKYVTSMSGTTTLTVAPPPPKYAYSNASLKGQYAFTITFISTTLLPCTNAAVAENCAPVPWYVVGSFNADGNGNISGSMDDPVDYIGVSNLTGSYTVYEGGFGDLFLNGLPSGSYRFVLSSNQSSPNNPAAEGQFVATGLGVSAIGTFVQQDSTYFSDAALNGTEVFRLNDGVSGEVGLFVSDGNGNINSAVAAGVGGSPVSLAGGTYSIASNGRGTLDFGGSSYVVYVVGNGNVILLSIQTGTSALGYAEQQATGITFSNATLAANTAYDFLLEYSPINFQLFDTIGHVGFDGLGNVTGGVQDECVTSGGSCLPSLNNTIQGGTYSVAANGQVTVTESTAAGTRTYIYYLVSASRAYLLNTQDGAVGTADLQTSTPSKSILNGDYAFASPTAVVWMYADGNGNVSGIGYDFVETPTGSVLSNVVFSGTYSVDVNGRTTLNLSPPIAEDEYIFDLLSNRESYMLGVTPNGSIVDGPVFLQ